MNSLSENESEETWDGVDNAKTSTISATSTNFASTLKDSINNVSDVFDIFTPEVTYNNRFKLQSIKGYKRNYHKETLQNSQKRKKIRCNNDSLTSDTKNHKSKEDNNDNTTVPLTVDSSSGSNSTMENPSPFDMKGLPTISLNAAIKMEKILYPAADLAKIPPDILLQLIRTGSLNIHTEDGKL